MDTKIIDTTIDTQELTLVDIEELRQAIGAEAMQTALAPTCGGSNPTTCMCPEWY